MGSDNAERQVVTLHNILVLKILNAYYYLHLYALTARASQPGIKYQITIKKVFHQINQTLFKMHLKSHHMLQ